jgi:hypothetical protein
MEEEKPKRLQRSDFAAIRTRLTSLHAALVEVQSRDDIYAGARQLGMLRKKTIVFGNEAEQTILFDYMNYSYRPRGFNSAELYLRTVKEKPDPFSQALLEVMSRAMYTIFRIDELKKEEDAVRITDLLLGTSEVMLDHSLSRNALVGSGMAGHLLRFDDFTLSTGGMVPLVGGEVFEEPFFKETVQGMDAGSVSRTDPAIRAKLARKVIATAIEHGYTERIRYR